MGGDVSVHISQMGGFGRCISKRLASHLGRVILLCFVEGPPWFIAKVDNLQCQFFHSVSVSMQRSAQTSWISWTSVLLSVTCESRGTCSPSWPSKMNSTKQILTWRSPNCYFRIDLNTIQETPSLIHDVYKDHVFRHPILTFHKVAFLFSLSVTTIMILGDHLGVVCGIMTFSGERMIIAVPNPE